MDDMDYQNENSKGFAQVVKVKVLTCYKKLLIQPDNKKLKYFHLVVAITLVYDFYLTGLIMGNYNFHKGLNPDFLNHKSNYAFICFIQCADIILNFLKMDGSARRANQNPKEIFFNYIKGNFLTDCIAVIPYSIVNS